MILLETFIKKVARALYQKSLNLKKGPSPEITNDIYHFCQEALQSM